MFTVKLQSMNNLTTSWFLFSSNEPDSTWWSFNFMKFSTTVKVSNYFYFKETWNKPFFNLDVIHCLAVMWLWISSKTHCWQFAEHLRGAVASIDEASVNLFLSCLAAGRNSLLHPSSSQCVSVSMVFKLWGKRSWEGSISFCTSCKMRCNLLSLRSIRIWLVGVC